MERTAYHKGVSLLKNLDVMSSFDDLIMTLQSVVDTARELKMPVLHTQVIPRGLTADHPLTKIVPELAPM